MQGHNWKCAGYELKFDTGKLHHNREVKLSPIPS